MASKLSLKRSRIRQGLEKASIFACLVLAMVMFIVGLSSGNDHLDNNSKEISRKGFVSSPREEEVPK